MNGYSIKKQNKKQVQHAGKKLFNEKRKTLAKMFLCMFLVFAVPTLVSAADNLNQDQTFELAPVAVVGGGMVYAILSMGAIGNIEDEPDINTQGNQIAYDIRLLEVTQVDNTQAFPLPNASREVGDIPLKAGEVPHQFDCHNMPTYNGTGTATDYTIDPTKNFPIVLANAFRDKTLNFVENKAGAKFIIFFRKAEESQWYIVGTYDKPMKFSDFEVKGDGDASVVLCTFSNKSVRQFYKYVGALSTAGPKTVAADTTTLAIDENDAYQLTNNTGATVINDLSGVASADYGRTITIYGSGGANAATIADSAKFVLREGATWTGNAGSRLTLRIMDSTTLVEIDRVQTA